MTQGYEGDTGMENGEENRQEKKMILSDDKISLEPLLFVIVIIICNP